MRSGEDPKQICGEVAQLCHTDTLRIGHDSRNNPSLMKRRAIAVHYMPGHTRFEPIGNHVSSRHVQVEPGELLEGQ